MRKRGRKGTGERGEGAPVRLRLYLADNAPASAQALKHVQASLGEVPPERYSLQIVDALTLPARALEDGVTLAPALVRDGATAAVLTTPFGEPGVLLDLLSGSAATAAALLPGDAGEKAAELVRRVSLARRELQEVVGERVDLALDPADGVPVLLPAALKAVGDEARNFRKVFESAPLGMALLSHDFRFIRTNERLSTLTGIPPGELMGMGLSDLTGEEGDAAERLNLSGTRACQTGFCEGETLVDRDRGGRVWLRLMLALVQQPQEGEALFLLIVQDVTGVKAAEAELHGYHVHLEDLVRERTAELAAANRRLVKEAEERLEAEDAVRALNEELEVRVRERTAELEESNSQLETMNRFFVGRELRMAELKREIDALREEVSKLKEGA